MDPGWVRYFIACTVLLVLLGIGVVVLWAIRRRVLDDAPATPAAGDGGGRWVAALGIVRGWAAAGDPTMGATWRTMEPGLRRALDECPPALRRPLAEALAGAVPLCGDAVAAAGMRVVREELLRRAGPAA